MKVSQSSWLNLGLNQQTLFSLVFITTTDSDQNLRKCYLWRHTDLTVLRLCAACQCSNNSVLLRITWIILLLIMMDKQSHRDGRYSSWQCTVPCCVSHQRHLTKRPPQGHSVDTHPHHQVLSSLAPSDSLEATANKLLHLPRGHSSCLSDRSLMSPPPPSRRPFPAGDRVTFNGKDCLCQYCVEPMSPGPKDILGSSSK